MKDFNLGLARSKLGSFCKENVSKHLGYIMSKFEPLRSSNCFKCYSVRRTGFFIAQDPSFLLSKENNSNWKPKWQTESCKRFKNIWNAQNTSFSTDANISLSEPEETSLFYKEMCSNFYVEHPRKSSRKGWEEPYHEGRLNSIFLSWQILLSFLWKPRTASSISTCIWGFSWIHHTLSFKDYKIQIITSLGYLCMIITSCSQSATKDKSRIWAINLSSSPAALLSVSTKLRNDVDRSDCDTSGKKS